MSRIRQQRADRALTEKDFMAQVLELARILGWRAAHFRPALTARGWRTPVQADGAGFPDLLLTRGDRLLAVELKRERGGVLSADQAAWLAALEAAGVECHLWRPSDWPQLQATLQAQSRAEAKLLGRGHGGKGNGYATPEERLAARRQTWREYTQRRKSA